MQTMNVAQRGAVQPRVTLRTQFGSCNAIRMVRRRMRDHRLPLAGCEGCSRISMSQSCRRLLHFPHLSHCFPTYSPFRPLPCSRRPALWLAPRLLWVWLRRQRLPLMRPRLSFGTSAALPSRCDSELMTLSGRQGAGDGLLRHRSVTAPPPCLPISPYGRINSISLDI